MTIQITGVRYSGYPKTHEAIAAFRWRDAVSGQVGSNDKPSLVAWLDEKTAGHAAFVADGQRQVAVGTVHPQYAQAYLRTYADGVWTDNLLALPTF